MFHNDLDLVYPAFTSVAAKAVHQEHDKLLGCRTWLTECAGQINIPRWKSLATSRLTILRPRAPVDASSLHVRRFTAYTELLMDVHSPEPRFVACFRHYMFSQALSKGGGLGSK